MTDFYITVDSDGNIAWFAPLVIETMCHLNVRLFPYDSQICNITLGSWTYNGFDIDVWMKNTEGIGQYSLSAQQAPMRVSGIALSTK